MRAHHIVLALASAAAAAACSSATAGVEAPAPSHAGEAPVVVELFTSQGCSSCPAADHVLAQIARDGGVGGRAVLPLSFHVDYWDDLGWPDPFALPAWTARQHAYADALGDRRVYTPELVVAGGAGLVGSRGDAVARAIAEAPPQAPVVAHATWSPERVVVSGTAPPDADLVVAVFQPETRTAVPRGENAGAVLDSTRVVRRLDRVAAAGTAGSVAIALDPAWRGVGAVVFAQRRDYRITGSALLMP